MKKFGIAVATVMAAAATPAFAQNDMAGPHIEAHLGWDSLAIPDLSGTTGEQSPRSRVLYGVGAGYDVDLGHNLVAGVDTNFDLGGATRCTGPVLTATDSVCGKMVHDWDIGARLGVKTGPGLIYGRVAYDDTRVRSDYLPGDGSSSSTSENFGGLRLGVGGELPLGRLAYLKAEYRYTTASALPDQNQLLAGFGVHF